MPYTGSKAGVLGYGTVLSIGPLASATGTPTYTPVYEVSNMKFPNAKRAIVETTNFNSPSDSIEKLGVAIDFGTVTFDTNYVPDDPGQVALLAAHTTGNGAPYLFKLALAIDTEDGETTTGPVAAFRAIISEGGGIDVSMKDVAKANWSLDITGAVTWTAGS